MPTLRAPHHAQLVVIVQINAPPLLWFLYLAQSVSIVKLILLLLSLVLLEPIPLRRMPLILQSASYARLVINVHSMQPHLLPALLDLWPCMKDRLHVLSVLQEYIALEMALSLQPVP